MARVARGSGDLLATEAKPLVGLGASLLADKGHLKKVNPKPHGFLRYVPLTKLGFNPTGV